MTGQNASPTQSDSPPGADEITATNRHLAHDVAPKAPGHGVRPPMWLLRALLLIAIIGLWQACAKFEWLPTLLVPPPYSVLTSLQNGIVGGSWWADIATTLEEAIVGFLIGLGSAIFVGAVFSSIPIVRSTVYPFMLYFYTFPKIALAPVLVVAFGFGELPKVILAAMLSFFPLLTATVAGLTEVSADDLQLMRSMPATRLQELKYLRIPNAMSYIFPALDVAVVLALLGAIVGELVGAKAGLGYLIQAQTALGNIPNVYAVLLIMGAIGVSLSAIINALRRILPVKVVPKSMSDHAL